MSRVLNAEGADNGLDVVVSLQTFGLLPQRVRLHGEAGDPDPGMMTSGRRSADICVLKMTKYLYCTLTEKN